MTSLAPRARLRAGVLQGKPGNVYVAVPASVAVIATVPVRAAVIARVRAIVTAFANVTATVGRS